MLSHANLPPLACSCPSLVLSQVYAILILNPNHSSRTYTLTVLLLLLPPTMFQ
jgi:hypothetical protein